MRSAAEDRRLPPRGTRPSVANQSTAEPRATFRRRCLAPGASSRARSRRFVMSSRATSPAARPGEQEQRGKDQGRESDAGHDGPPPMKKSKRCAGSRGSLFNARHNRGKVSASVAPILTVDVEDWFHVCGHRAYSDPGTWAGREKTGPRRGRAHPRAPRRIGLDGDVLRPRLDRPSEPGARQADRGRGARDRLSRRPPPPRLRDDARGVPRGPPRRAATRCRRSSEGP